MIALLDLNRALQLKQKPNDILCVGEILVDLIASDYSESIREQSFTPYFGGSPANIAINAKRLGLNTEIAACVGADRFGDFLIDYLKEASLSTDYIVRDEKAATSMVVLNRSKATPIPMFYRYADYQLKYTDTIKQRLQQSSILHLSSWPASKMPARQCISEMIEDARKENIIIGFDPNFHPSVWDEGEAAREFLFDMLAKVDVIKPSLDDAERIFGIADPTTQLNRFLEKGAKLVILTLGADGAIISNGRQKVMLPTLATEVLDTTGAGDAFWSGFYAGLISQSTLLEAIQIGLAVSAYKLRYIGAITPLPNLSDIKKQYKL